MQEIFLKVVSIGINASWMILAVLLLRVLFWKSPKWVMCFLWILVGIRLIYPWDIESTISLIPVRLEASHEYSEKQVDKNDGDITYIHIDRHLMANEHTNPAKNVFQSSGAGRIEETIMADREPDPTDGKAEHIVLDHDAVTVFIIIWLCGIFVMIFYFIASYIYIYKKTETATLLRENIWESEFATLPFVFGLIRPKVYIPYGMNQEQLVYVLAHERTHLKRNDHIVKLTAFLILSVYWFQPFVWAAYIFLSRDMELACDEKVVVTMDNQEREKYLLTLLNCSTAKKRTGMYPLAFGQIGIKERVIRMKKWEKPSFLFVIATMLVSITVSLCLLTNPKREEAEVVKAQKEADQEAGTLEVKKASADLRKNTGADGTMIYYVDEDKIIFGGNFGLFVHDKASGEIVQSLDLEYIGCHQTQGDNYCEIAVDKHGERIYLNPLRQKKLYVLDLLSGKLGVKDYPDSDLWKDRSLDLFRVKNSKQVSYYNSKNEKIVCKLNETDFTIGNCSYAEYSPNEAAGREKKNYYPLFPHNK